MNEQLAKFFSGECSEQETSEMMSWRAESEENAKAFLEAKEVWFSTTDHKAIAAPKSVLDEILSEGSEVELNKSNPFVWLRYAALIVAFSSVAFWFFNNNKSDSFALPLATEQILDDGSTIALHANSSIEVLEMSEEKRVVKLDGKAFFDITSDADRPFFIQTNDLLIRVVGTAFLVDENFDGTTGVFVEHGKVGVTGNTSDTEVFLEKGDQGFINADNEVVKDRIENENYLSWNTGVIRFQNTELNEVAKVLKDVYGVEMSYKDKNFGNCRLTATFKQRNADEISEIIGATFGWELKSNKNKVDFTGEPCD